MSISYNSNIPTWTYSWWVTFPNLSVELKPVATQKVISSKNWTKNTLGIVRKTTELCNKQDNHTYSLVNHIKSMTPILNQKDVNTQVQNNNNYIS